MNKYSPYLLCLLLLNLFIHSGCQYFQPPVKETSPSVEEKPVISKEIVDKEIKTAADEIEIPAKEIEMVSKDMKTPYEVPEPKEIASFQGAVAHIMCSTNIDEEGFSAGSGIVYNEDGLILTNNHVIPNDNEYLYTTTEGCFVTLPDPETGLMTDKMYYARPKVVKDISNQYDLATLEIYKVESFTSAKIPPKPPKKFPNFDISEGCSLDDLNLKDKIEVYGYPDVGGILGTSISLVVTDGIISSFPGDGTILTNAKINEGNSGGLAIREDGCFVGIPVAAYSGTMESYGYIISTDLIDEYFAEAKNGVYLTESESPYKAASEDIKTYYDYDDTYKHAAYVTIVGAEIIQNREGKLRLVLNGNVSSNCTQIDVNVVNRDRYLNDSHILNEWNPGETTFVYRLAPDLGNIGIGYNDITIVATCEGGQKPTYSETLPYGI